MASIKKQLYILADLEGASQISDTNRKAMWYGSELWHKEGRGFITSDVKAVCEAAFEFGIDQIIINDEHDLGNKEPNLLVGELPGNVTVLKRPTLPGKARKSFKSDPFGMVFVGQHARYGGGGFAPHTIQSPPIAEIAVNGIPMGEIGLELAMFVGVPLLANIGEEASCREAAELCPRVVSIPVKDLEKNWFPTAAETYPLIKQGVLKALRQRDHADALHIRPPFEFSMKVTETHFFDSQHTRGLGWLSKFFFFYIYKGKLNETSASWRSKTIVSGIYTVHMLRSLIRKRT
jgi:D-aminopeptidase